MELKFTKSVLASCFPFYIAADRNWNVVATGPSLSRVMGETAIGEKLDSLFHMSRPLDTDLEDYHAKYAHVLVFLTDTKRQLKYRGQLFLTEDKNTIFFLQAPIITDLASLENQGILFTDFSLTDPVLDYLIMVQSHKELLEKSQKLNKQLERSINIAESASQKYLALLKVVMHDLSNPLAAIKMGVDRLVRKSFSPDRLLARLQNSTNAMVDIIDLTRESLFRTNTDSQDSTIKIRPETINVRSIIDESLDIFDQQIKAKNIAINKLAVEKNRIIVSDRRILIYQIFNNILSNAIKFSYERGSIDISTSTSENHLTVVFKDHGCGIKKEDFEKVTSRKSSFSSNGTRGEKGTGIGLKNVYYFSDLLGAQISIESRHHTNYEADSRGTNIAVTIPLEIDKNFIDF